MQQRDLVRHAGLGVLLALGGLALAQDPAPRIPASTAPAPATKVPQDAAATIERDAAAAPDEKPARDANPVNDPEPATTPARKPAAATGSPQHFEPTEKVRPDFDVAFPVDI